MPTQMCWLLDFPIIGDQTSNSTVIEIVAVRRIVKDTGRAFHLQDARINNDKCLNEVRS